MFTDPTGLYEWGANAGNDASDEELKKSSKSKDKRERNAAQGTKVIRREDLGPK
jgi:hypothetical protein